MDISIETIQMAEDILTSIDANEEFMEHHGVKGQKHGVRRYQNDDGSLTALGRQHYGIFGRLRSHFNPAERGYRAAVKQQQQQQKIAVKKAKYAGDIKKMMKKRKYFTDEEIERKIDTDTRLQQKRNHLNELMRADKIKRKEEKMAEKERKEAIKESKFQQELQKEAIKSQEKQHKLEQKTLLDVQKQKDQAQAEREQAQREYQTQQKIAQGKTLLGRLQKGAQMTAAIMGIASNVSKTAGILKEMGFVPKKVDEAAKKINEAKEAAKKVTKSKLEKNTIETDVKSDNDKKQTPLTDEKRLLPEKSSAHKKSKEEKRAEKEEAIQKEMEAEKKRQRDYNEFSKEAIDMQGIYETAYIDSNKISTHMGDRGYSDRLGGNFSKEELKNVERAKERAQAKAALIELDQVDAMMNSPIPNHSKDKTDGLLVRFKDVVAKVKGEPLPSELAMREKIQNEMDRKEQRGRLQNIVNSMSDDEYNSVKEMARERMASRDKQLQAIREEQAKRSEKRAAEREKQKAEAQERLRKQREWMAEQEEKQKEQQEAAQDRAEQIIENAREVKMKSTGPLSDTVKYVTSMSASKLASMLSGEVPNSMPDKINLGSLMKTTISQQPNYLEGLRASKKIKHDDIEEEIAGEIEDAE